MNQALHLTASSCVVRLPWKPFPLLAAGEFDLLTTGMLSRLIALAILFGAASCDRNASSKPHLKYQSDQTLHEDAKGRISFTTHYTEGVIGLPVWQVWIRVAGATDPTCLFTVERVWQESEPGSPVFDDASGDLIIRDASRSYIYSLRQRAFTHNSNDPVVYAGPYKR